MFIYLIILILHDHRPKAVMENRLFYIFCFPNYGDGNFFVTKLSLAGRGGGGGGDLGTDLQSSAVQ